MAKNLKKINFKKIIRDGMLVAGLTTLCYCSDAAFAASASDLSKFCIDVGYNKNTIAYDSSKLDSNYTSALTSVKNSWNSKFYSGTFQLKSDTSSANLVVSSALSTITYPNVTGMYSIITKNSNTWRKCTKFTITVNTNVTKTGATSNYKQSVLAHEFGHALSLKDLDTAGTTTYKTTSIMSYARNRETLIAGTTTDLAHVNYFK